MVSLPFILLFCWSWFHFLVNSTELSESFASGFGHKHFREDGSEGAHDAVQQEDGVQAQGGDEEGHQLDPYEDGSGPGKDIAAEVVEGEAFT